MVQGKFKKSAKQSPAVKNKAKKKNLSFTRRANAPVNPKKAKQTEEQKIKKIITKSVNKSAESEIRSIAMEGTIKLSKAQIAVANHNKKVNNMKKTTS